MKFGIRLRYQSGLWAGSVYAVVRFPYLPKLFETAGEAAEYRRVHYPQGKRATVLADIVPERMAFFCCGKFYVQQTGKPYMDAVPKLLAWEQQVLRDLARHAERKSYQQRGIVAPVRRGMHFDFPEENHATT